MREMQAVTTASSRSWMAETQNGPGDDTRVAAAAAYAYSEQQLDRYLDHVGYPQSQHADDRLTMLAELMARQICRVPFESLGLHYSRHRTLSLDPEALYRKVVVEGRGGYCMELNSFFAGMLRGLGFAVISVAGRVNSQGQYGGWSHMLNLVSVAGRRYAVDVGFGSHEAMRPVPLEPGVEFAQVAPRRGRLEFRPLAQHSDPGQRLWVYSTQECGGGPWTERYCFCEAECFPNDYRLANYFTMSHPTSYFVQTVLAMRGLLDAETCSVAGIVTLHRDQVKRRVAGSDTELLATLRTEDERIEALERYFDIVLTSPQRKGIRGMASELKSWHEVA